MKKGIGYASVTATASLTLLCLAGLSASTIVASISFTAIDGRSGSVAMTWWECIRAMGGFGPLLILLAVIWVVAFIINLVNLRRLGAYVIPSGSPPPDIASFTEGFLIAPGALIGTGAVSLVVGGLGTATTLSWVFAVYASSIADPDPNPCLRLFMSLLPARFGFLIGALAIVSGLIFRGLVALRRAKLIAACAKGSGDPGPVQPLAPP
ncbi:MAG: hypothetical protein JXP34_06125 [Planctomycetes bacterium]|nr:hypothetical protein [Planctomycetota bacterium]